MSHPILSMNESNKTTRTQQQQEKKKTVNNSSALHSAILAISISEKLTESENMAESSRT